jgi:hypothetical protein
VSYTRTNPTVFDGYGEDAKVGDKITVIALREIGSGTYTTGAERSDVRQGKVVDVRTTNGYNQRGFTWAAVDGYRECGWLKDEGVSWIRGWHKSESSAVDALLAIAHLNRSAA